MYMKNIYMTKFVSIILLVSIILCFCFVLIHINHECSHNDNCVVCKLLNRIKDDLCGFNNNVIKLIINIIMFFSIGNLFVFNLNDKKKLTLIGLKVELNN